MGEHQGSADCMVTKEKVSRGSDDRQEGVLVAGTLEHMGRPFPTPITQRSIPHSFVQSHMIAVTTDSFCIKSHHL